MISVRERLALPIAALVASTGLIAAPGAAHARPPEPTPNPWQMRHWPQTQPWQRGGAGRGPEVPGRRRAASRSTRRTTSCPTHDLGRLPADPGHELGRPGRAGLGAQLQGRAGAGRLPEPAVRGHPAGELHRLRQPAAGRTTSRGPRSPQFYQDFLNTPERRSTAATPSTSTGWRTPAAGTASTSAAFGAYQMPAKSHEYGIEPSFQRGAGCPAGDTCSTGHPHRRPRAPGSPTSARRSPTQYDFVFFLTAGQDESATWQEFGEMKFQTKEDVTDEFGPPDAGAAELEQRPATSTWTSWQAGAEHLAERRRRQLDPGGELGHGRRTRTSSATSSASATTTTTRTRCRPAAPTAGPGTMSPRHVQRPGRPAQPLADPGRPAARRWARSTCCATRSSSASSTSSNVLRLVPRRRWPTPAWSWPRVTARAVAAPARPGSPASTSRWTTATCSPPCDVADRPAAATAAATTTTRVEVVDRMGTDSFTPDTGVLLAKTKNADTAPFMWVVDANPQDIDMVDFVRPDGTPAEDDHRRLPAALRRAVPRRHRLGQRVRVRRQGQPAALLRARHPARPARRPVLHRRGPLARRRRAAAARRRGCTRRSAIAPRHGGWAKCMLPAAQHRPRGAGQPATRRTSPRTPAPTSTACRRR